MQESFFSLVDRIQEEIPASLFPEYDLLEEDDDEIDFQEIYSEKSFQEIVSEEKHLNYYTRQPYIDASKALLRSPQNFNFNELNYDTQKTILMSVLFIEDLELVKQLVELGADINFECDDGNFALNLVAIHGYTEIYNYLYPMTKPEFQTIAEQSIAEGLKEKRRRENSSPEIEALATAAMYGNLEAVKTAASQAVDINGCSYHGEAALHRASRSNHLQVCRYLLKEGADPNILDECDENKTPLFKAVEEGNIEIVKLLVQSGSDVNRVNNEGRTPLAYAVSNQDIEIVQVLTSTGIDIHLKDHSGKSALDYALEAREYFEDEDDIRDIQKMIDLMTQRPTS